MNSHKCSLRDDSQFLENYGSNWKFSDLMSFQTSQIYSKTAVCWKQVTLLHCLVLGVIRCIFKSNVSLSYFLNIWYEGTDAIQ